MKIKVKLLTLSILSGILIYLFTPPALSNIRAIDNCSDCHTIEEKIERKDHLFESINKKYDDKSHMSKTEFRLTPPLIFKILHFNNRYQVFVLQFLLSIVFFYFLSYFIYKNTKSFNSTILGTIAFSFIFIGKSFIADYAGYFDFFSFSFLLISLLDIPIIIFISCLLLAFFTDERSMISSLLVLFYWQLFYYKEKGKNFLHISTKTIGLVISIILYFVFRFVLISYFGFVNQTGAVGLDIMKITITWIDYAVINVFEGFWIVILLAIKKMAQKETKLIFFSFLAINFVGFMSCFLVYDLSRSLGYLFPSILISLYILKLYLNENYMKKLLVISLLFCIIIPSFTIVAVTPRLPDQLFIRILTHFLGN